MPLDSNYDQVLARLNQCMKRKNQPDRSFICEHELDSIWSSLSIIRPVLGGRWSDSDLQVIQTRYKKVLSILILIGAKLTLANFRSLVLNATPHPLMPQGDDKLPLPEKALQTFPFLDPAQQCQFLEKQYIFLPIEIKKPQRQDILEVPSPFRLPFISEEEFVTCGGYGEVSKVEIAHGYLDDDTGVRRPRMRCSSMLLLYLS